MDVFMRTNLIHRAIERNVDVKLNIFSILFQINHYRDLSVEYTFNKSNNCCFHISLVYSAAQNDTLHFTVVNYYLLSAQKWLYLKTTTMVCYIIDFYIVIQWHWTLFLTNIIDRPFRRRPFRIFYSPNSVSDCILRHVTARNKFWTSNRREITLNGNISCSINNVVFKTADLWNIWFEGYKQLFGWVPLYCATLYSNDYNRTCL